MLTYEIVRQKFVAKVFTLPIIFMVISRFLKVSRNTK
jgi:hypothetical protein